MIEKKLYRITLSKLRIRYDYYQNNISYHLYLHQLQRLIKISKILTKLN